MRLRLISPLLLFTFGFHLTAAEVRLAIVADDDTNRVAADTLTAAFSSVPGVVLLERNEVERVYHEQTLPSASVPSTDFVRLGRLLRADGLILLQSTRNQTSTNLGVRLVTVNTGVVLDAATFPLPLPDPDQWSRLVTARFAPLMKKLDVPRDRAVPISILNLHAALSTPTESETERSLNHLVFYRLAQERELFVLERRQMEKLQWEKELPGPDDQPFWNGSYLLEGVIDRDGPSPDTVTLHARLTPPDGTNVVTMEVAGARDNLPRLAEELTGKILTALKKQTTVQSWDRDSEAARFEKEATWATTWRMWPEAAAAAESAWALGHRTVGNATLRVRALLAQSGSKEELVFDPVRNFGWAENPQPPELLASATAAVEAYLALCNSTDRSVWQTNAAWLDLGLDTLRGASLALRHRYHFDARKGVYDEPALPVLRSAARDLAATLPPGVRRSKLRELYPGYTPPPAPEDANSLEMARGVFGTLWQETPRDTLKLYQDMLDSGTFDRQLKFIIGHDWSDPSWVAWNPSDRESGAALWKAFVENLELSTNRAVRADGALLALQSARFDPDMALAIETFLEATMDKNTGRFLPAFPFSVIDVFNDLLRAKCGQKPITRRREQFLAEWKTLRFARREHYLQTVAEFDPYRGGEDFLRAWFSREQASELLPVAENYARRFPNGEEIGQIVQHIRELTTNAPDPYAEFFYDPDFDVARYDELFANHEFTPAEAQRVLTGLTDYLNRGHGWPKRLELEDLRAKLRTIAASTQPPPLPAKPAGPPPAVFEWNHVFLPETREEDPPRKSSGTYLTLYPYEGHIFAAVEIDDSLYRMRTGGNFGFGGGYDLYEIDPVANNSRELARRLPQTGLSMGPKIDVTHDMVYWVESPTVIGRVDRVTGKAERFEVDLPPEFSFVKAFGSRVFVVSADYIAELFPRDGSLKLLASKRRNPPANRLDAAGWSGFPDLALQSNGVLAATMEKQTWTYDGRMADWTSSPSPTNSTRPLASFFGANYGDVRRWSRPYRFSEISLNNFTSVSNFDGSNLWIFAANKAADHQFTLFWFDADWELPREIPIMFSTPHVGSFPSDFGTRAPTVAFLPEGIFVAPGEMAASGSECFWFIPWDDLKGWARAHHPDVRNIPRREPILLATYDTNHDGILETNELEAMYDDPAWKKSDAEFQARRLLYSFDTNNDNALEGDELQKIMRLGLGFSGNRLARGNPSLPAALARAAAGPRQVPLGTLAPTVARLLERFDKNHDQALDVEELTDLFIAINSPPEPVARGPGQSGRRGPPFNSPGALTNNPANTRGFGLSSPTNRPAPDQ